MKDAAHPGGGKWEWQLHFGSPASFCLLIGAMFVGLFNHRFWLEAGAAFWHGQVLELAYLFFLMLLLVLGHAGALALVPGRKALMAVSALLFPLASMAAYCADTFGVAIDREMLRNIGGTDQAEALALFGPRLAGYVIGLGALPVLLVARSRIAPLPRRREWRDRAAVIGSALLLAAFMLAAFGQQVRELAYRQQALHYLLVPAAALQGMADLIRDDRLAADEAPADARAWSAKQEPPSARPLLVFFVIGETARHANFQLGGYSRPTNPELQALGNVYYFGKTEACATSTAVSVPCMLSPLDRANFSMARARQVPNALDALQGAGVDVRWRSNNSGGRDSSARVADVHLADAEHDPRCQRGACPDEVLLDGLEQTLAGLAGDAVIVFHTMGSHGPAYHARTTYPPGQEPFRPACRQSQPRDCTREELLNAYDNTIHYTDHFLGTLVRTLQRQAARFDTALVYVSDHGESLGERGIYLHSAPAAIAPEEQRHIPLLLWTSPGFLRRQALAPGCLDAVRQKPASHDNIYHTLLGAMQVRSGWYRDDLDLLSVCRSAGN
ncbi:phosphoethanolamine transferase [Noviherbaspirillum galbum]|uniref:Sulfatase-like hydrolase/transferase n=1 Tax=Noviherbaspirillum galbum TaxID=2709383 RepID=A0A6B3SJS5_9BURK|nr:sulfatase-like hydrolase/transferase [Noviherbaspirillum galbum]NEX59605.1 sulfatase-like hydrolase/transferase [Noviherbaspirillum galbum]